MQYNFSVECYTSANNSQDENVLEPITSVPVLHYLQVVLFLKFEHFAWISYATLFEIRRYQLPFLSGWKYPVLPDQCSYEFYQSFTNTYILKKKNCLVNSD